MSLVCMWGVYLVTFKRENGTIGNDSIHAGSVNEAIKQFNEIYRYGKYEILSCVPMCK